MNETWEEALGSIHTSTSKPNSVKLKTMHELKTILDLGDRGKIHVGNTISHCSSLCFIFEIYNGMARECVSHIKTNNLTRFKDFFILKKCRKSEGSQVSLVTSLIDFCQIAPHRLAHILMHIRFG